MRVIGQRVRHVDWRAVTSGAASYADDEAHPGALVAGVLRSPHPHARIVSIRTDRARAVPGVQAVLTAADVPDRTYLDYRVPDQDRRILAEDVVRHVGAVVAHWRADEQRLHVWAPSQNPRLIQRDLAQLFGLDVAAVRLHELTVGGDFGGRTQISSTEALICALSLATGRPVKLRQSRAEEFAFTKYRVPWDITLEAACDDDGRVTTLQASFDIDNGAYNQAAPGEMAYGATALASSYRWQGYRAGGRCVYTAKTLSSSFHGAGGYAVTWALECAVDGLAERAGWDPIDFRLRNAVADPGVGRTAERACAAWEHGTHPLPGNHWKVFATSGLVRAALDELFGGAR
ncbi:xanthine dehydrogenase family protein molybdopterin-binding subunit [Streptomyces sp. NPDC004227]